jgi:carbonic anhydrase
VKIIEITYRYDSSGEPGRPRPLDADEARDRLDAGSRSIAALLDGLQEGTGTARRIIAVDPADLGLAPGVPGAPKQRPYAAVLGCSDARVPIELIFNEGPNDLFVVRVAGNGLGGEVLGSLKYAVDHLGASLKLVVVLGHSGCGAVSGAVDLFLKPKDYLALAGKHSLRNILDRLILLVHAAANRMAAVHGSEISRHPAYREALVEASIAANAALTAYTLQHELGADGSHDIRAAYGVYLLAERQIWAPRSDGDECAGLAYAATGADAFAGFADAVVKSRGLPRCWREARASAAASLSHGVVAE